MRKRRRAGRVTEPRNALEQAGASTDLISPEDEIVAGWSFSEWGEEFPVDEPLDSARPEDYDALFLPGGAMNADALRMNPKAVDFVKASSMGLASR